MQKSKERIVLVTSLILLDTMAISFALALAYYLCVARGLLPYYGPEELTVFARTAGMAVPIWILICAGFRLYDRHYLLAGPQEYAQIVKACTFGIVPLIVLSFWESLFSGGWLLMAWTLSIVLVGSARVAFRRVIFRLRRRGLFISRALIIGANEHAKSIARQLHSPVGSGVQVIGFLDDYLPQASRVLDDLEVLGSPIEIERWAREGGVEEVIVVPDALAWESFQEIIQRVASSLNDVDVKLSPGLYEVLTTGVKVSHRAFVPLLTVERVRITGFNAVLKNLLDYGLGAILLLVTAPVTGIIALTVWLVEGHPILDRPPVLGARGRPFQTLKFHTGLLGSGRRSLVTPLPVRQNNPGHASRLGDFLFRTALDKLPQLLNVMRGEMSLVGPRTVSVGTEDRYGSWLPSLLTVKPGITGPWAVSNAPSLDDEVRLTMYYIRNWTIWFDLQVLFQTAKHVLLGGVRRSISKEQVKEEERETVRRLIEEEADERGKEKEEIGTTGQQSGRGV